MQRYLVVTYFLALLAMGLAVSNVRVTRITNTSGHVSWQLFDAIDTFGDRTSATLTEGNTEFDFPTRSAVGGHRYYSGYIPGNSIWTTPARFNFTLTAYNPGPFGLPDDGYLSYGAPDATETGNLSITTHWYTSISTIYYKPAVPSSKGGAELSVLVTLLTQPDNLLPQGLTYRTSLSCNKTTATCSKAVALDVYNGSDAQQHPLPPVQKITFQFINNVQADNSFLLGQLVFGEHVNTTYAVYVNNVLKGTTKPGRGANGLNLLNLQPATDYRVKVVATQTGSFKQATFTTSA